MREKWYGYAGHFIGGKRCAYHLCTRIRGYMISTIGHYMPKGIDEMETIGSGKDALFETMVFKCSGEDMYGNPIIDDWGSIDGDRYADSLSAEKGHYEYLAKYKKKRRKTGDN